MSNSNYRIPDDMAAEVLAEAARLYAQANKGYSFEDLQQACSEAQIPSHIIRQALRNVEEKRSREHTKRRQEQEYINQLVRRGVSMGIAFLIPAIAVSSIFIFRSQLKPVVSKLSFPKLSSPSKTLTVQKDKLEYLTDSKGLSISVTNVSSVEATIGTDGYKNLYISYNCSTDDNCLSRRLGESFDYKGIYNYRIKIIEINDDSVKFQIDQQGEQPQSPVKRLGEEVKQLQQQRQELQSKIQQQHHELQSKIEELQNEQNDIKQKLQQRDQTIKRLKQENNRLTSIPLPSPSELPSPN